MKTTNKIALLVGLSSVAALPVLARLSVVVGVPAPQVVVAPSVTVETTAPDGYVWDGEEYVGMVGTDYYYLGPDHYWRPFDSVREAHFNRWEAGHGDWREHMIHNEVYRNDIHGAPGHDFPGHEHEWDHRGHR
jgi:hypothetical protein